MLRSNTSLNLASGPLYQWRPKAYSVAQSDDYKLVVENYWRRPVIRQEKSGAMSCSNQPPMVSTTRPLSMSVACTAGFD
jgi:hypothetical protein